MRASKDSDDNEYEERTAITYLWLRFQCILGVAFDERFHGFRLVLWRSAQELLSHPIIQQDILNAERARTSAYNPERRVVRVDIGLFYSAREDQP